VSVGALLLLVTPRLPYPGDEIGARLARLVIMSVGLQLLAGLVNVLLLAPIWMQMTHLLLADLVWILFVLLSAQCLRTVDLVRSP
jgi:heme A synthase